MKITRLVTICLLLVPGWAVAADFSQSVPVQDGGTLEIDLDSGDLEIETHPLAEVQVDAYAPSSFLGTVRFELSSDGRDAELKSEGGGWPFGGRVRVRVRVPERYSLEVETRGGRIEIAPIGGAVEARTSGGKIELDGADGEVELRTSGGSIRVAQVTGDVEARTSGGPIRVSEVVGEVDVETSGGSIGVYDVIGPVNARTSGGSIEVRFLERPEGDLQTSGGSILAELPADAGVDLDAETSGGRVEIASELRVEGEVSRSKVSGELNGGGPDLQLRTSGGNVRVRVR